MKNLMILMAGIMMMSCSGGDFGTVGKKFDVEKYSIEKGSLERGYILSKDGKKGLVAHEQIVVPAIFDKLDPLEKDIDGKVFFKVTKDGKQGLVKETEKKYIVPCDYEKMDVVPSANLLFLQKPGENMMTYEFSTGKKWQSDAFWPPKEFPCDVPFKVLQDLVNWEIESITCTGRAEKSANSGYTFKVKGVGKQNSSRKYRSNQIEFYPEQEGSNVIQQSLGSIYFFPKANPGEPFETEFAGLFDSYFRDVKFVGFIIQ